MKKTFILRLCSGQVLLFFLVALFSYSTAFAVEVAPRSSGGELIEWMLGFFTGVALFLLGIAGWMFWNQQKKMTQIETSLETQKDELSFLKTLIEKLLPPKGVV